MFWHSIRILTLGEIWMYLEKIYYLGKYREVARYYPGNYGAPGCKRRARHKPTPEDVAEQNKRNRERYIQRLILANFSEGDWWLTLTYRKEERPGSIEEAVDDRRKLIKRLQKEYREIRASCTEKETRFHDSGRVFRVLSKPGAKRYV